MNSHRIWVSEDRCTLVTIWYEMPAGQGDPGLVTVAQRDDPSYTWGPPVTLNEEKT